MAHGGGWIAVESSALEEGGHKRRLKLVDGTEITEQLEKFDGEARTYTYSIVTGPLPLADYRSTITRQVRQPSRCVSMLLMRIRPLSHLWWPPLSGGPNVLRAGHLHTRPKRIAPVHSAPGS